MILDWMYTCELIYETGQNYVYSDLSMVFLKLVVEKIVDDTLENFVEE